MNTRVSTRASTRVSTKTLNSGDPAGNPTFQTPGIRAFAVNASIAGSNARGRAAAFPLWDGGGRRALSGALLNDTLPPGLEGQYTADQVKLMCIAEVREFSNATCAHTS